MKARCIAIAAFILIISSSASLAAQSGIVVPNVIGLTVPRAAALLNRAGLTLGAQGLVAWTPESSQAMGRIDQQSPAAGEYVEPGAPIDITVFGSPNAALLYDEDELTVINLTDVPLDMSSVTFNALDGGAASYSASSWSGSLQGRKCFQIWSVSRSEPKRVDGCASIQNWRWTGNGGAHFWMTSDGRTRFSVMEGGVQQAVCNSAPPGSDAQPLHCDLLITGGSQPEQVTAYVYFAYTTEAFVFLNNSTDQWMPTTQTTIFNYNPQLSAPGLSISTGDASLYGSPMTVADIGRLAPGQCLLFTNANPDAALPEPCDVVARLDIDATTTFWMASFEVDNASDDIRRSCPAAEADKTVVCILPR